MYICIYMCVCVCVRVCVCTHTHTHSIREFLHSTNYSKYIIPILVPKLDVSCRGENNQLISKDASSNGHPASWTSKTQADDSDWWRHCHTCTGSSLPNNPDTGKSFTWSALAQFKPIDMRFVEDWRSHEDEIIKRIQARFHRGGYVRHETEIRYELWRKKAILCPLGYHTFASVQDLERAARDQFEEMDLDKDGKISADELLRAFPEIGTEQVAMDLVSDADISGNGLIDFDEWWWVVQAVAGEKRSLKTKKTRAPSFTSSETLGSLKPEERKKFPLAVCREQLLEECPQLSRELATSLIADADSDNDGLLLFDELFAIVQRQVEAI